MRIFILAACAVLLGCHIAAAECRQFIELLPAKEVAKEMGTTEAWVVANHKINVWSKPTEKGRYPRVGYLLPGSRALLLDTSIQDVRVRSPFDKSVGWVGKIQVKGTLMLDDKTYEPCK